MKRVILFTILVFVTSCSRYEPPNYEELKSSFIRNEDTFRELKDMIASDTPKGSCGAVSDDHIMDWWEYSGLWTTSQNYDRKVDLSQVLSEVGISQERYRMYLKKLAQIGASEGVSHCNELLMIQGTKNTSTRFTLAASGLAVSGCITDVIHRGSLPIPESEEAPGYFYKRVRIDENWYIEHSCT
jgi:hypothetical protein